MNNIANMNIGDHSFVTRIIVLGNQADEKCIVIL